MIIEGDCLVAMRAMEAHSADAVVTDPPYGLSREPDIAEVLRHWLAGDKYEHGGGGFMGKTWDSFVPGPEYWREAYRVLKPGGYLLAFAGTRTWDLMSMAIRFGGFVNRDTVRHDYGPPVLGWTHGQGFPKSKALLKPAWEPILIFRKPGPLRDLNIDGCRVAGPAEKPGSIRKNRHFDPNTKRDGNEIVAAPEPHPAGRWPANFVLSHSEGCAMVGTKRVKGSHNATGNGTHVQGVTYSQLSQSNDRQAHVYARPDGTEEVPAYRCAPGCPVALLDEQSVTAGVHGRGAKVPTKRGENRHAYGAMTGGESDAPHWREPSGPASASRFYHCLPADPFVYQAKASRRDRGEGNNHPTVKPVALMQWLVRLVSQPGDLILDPFAGSGTAGVACQREGRRFIGIEQDAESVATARRRLAVESPQDQLPLAVGV